MQKVCEIAGSELIYNAARLESYRSRNQNKDDGRRRTVRENLFPGSEAFRPNRSWNRNDAGTAESCAGVKKSGVCGYWLCVWRRTLVTELDGSMARL